MNRSCIASAVVLAALLATSCQSMSSILALEGRAMVLDDAEIDEVQGGGSLSDADVDLQSYGVHAALMTPIVDVIGGIDRRDYESEDTTEATIGLRKRFLEIWRFRPYVEASYRYGFDLDTGDVSEDYFGYNYGAGVLVDLTSSLFLNVRVVNEVTTVDVPGGDTDIEGLVGTIGIGFQF